MRKVSFFLLFIILSWSISIRAQEAPKSAVIAFYNLENLFDTINDPNINDEQFLPTGDYQWTSERYLTKLDRMSEVIDALWQVNGGPVIMGVSEVENEGVLKDLISTERLKKYPIGICHHDSPDRRGIDVSFLYNTKRFRILSTKAYPLHFPENPDFITRDQWLMTGILDGTDTINIIVNHWPSKSGGEKRSMPYRNGAAALCRHIADSIMHASKNAKVIIMGDLNDNPNARSIMETLGTKTNTTGVGEYDLFNPMWQLYRDGIGSYAYRDSWELIDNIIVSGGLINPVRGYKYMSVHIFKKGFMITKTGSYMGYPFRTYAGGSYQGGYSDHLPVYIILQK